MDIKEEKIVYKNNSPYELCLCNISHLKPHWHQHELELVFCLKGSVTLVAGHQLFEINAGEIVSVDYQDIHYLYSNTDNTVLIFHLDLTKLKTSWSYLKNIFFSCESSHCFPYQNNAMRTIKDILLSLSYSQYKKAEISTNCFKKNDEQNISEHLVQLLLKYFNWYNYESQDGYMNLELQDRFYTVLAYCLENYKKKISISQLTATLHINKNYFSQFISKTVFSNFNSLIKYIRCYNAEYLLLTTDMPISEISYTCGFSDPKYFYSAFKLWWGKTPKSHRDDYEKYMETNEIIQIYDAISASKFIESQIVAQHIKKTFFNM